MTQAINVNPQKKDLILSLKREILSLEGAGSSPESKIVYTGMAAIDNAFPGQVFPGYSLHEFISTAAEHAAATNGFITSLLSRLAPSSGVCIWISTKRTLFPPALKAFGIAPERIIFVDLQREKEALWAIEAALRCTAITAVIGELSELSFTESRRLQLAVEESRITAFIHRHRPRIENTTASASRWKISTLSSLPAASLPGIGRPRWNVQLLKVRNGRPGSWQVEWTPGGFRIIPLLTQSAPKDAMLKTG